MITDNTEERQRRVETERDYVDSRRYGFSLENILRRYPEGAPDHVIASALMISEEEVQELYQQAVDRLRAIMGVEVDSPNEAVK